MDAYKKIPYGLSSYKTIKRENYYYVDKSRYIPKLEAAGKFLFLIRPRRFGKSSLLSLLECYYDIARKDEFDLLFNDTYIKDHPTPEKNTHLILKFNLSQVSPETDKVEKSFKEHTDTCFFFFGDQYQEFLGDSYFQMMEKKESPHGKLEFLLRYVGSKGLKVLVLIDEYDNFANTILTTEGNEKYHDLTHGTGFFRFFFNVLKGAVDQVDTGVGRMFITGVSPVTMDDVTSGFNIGKNISLNPIFRELLGFTEADVLNIIKYYGDIRRGMPDAAELLNFMKEWCGNYRFSPDVGEKLFNTDMVLYHLDSLFEVGKYPEELIDQNVKIDYGKLRHLVTIDRQLNGNFSRLSEIIEKGVISSRVALSFPLKYLVDPENFVSLLFYFGLLSYSARDELIIPNMTVRKLMYNYLRDGGEVSDCLGVGLRKRFLVVGRQSGKLTIDY